ncbi:MAG TPA: hypothetical protein ENO17_08050 [Candidatus Atribacteria bacterium]|nr:hypothetical protein [Candidatus Atribacteria bacterium]
MKELCLTVTLPSLQVTIPEGKLNFQYLEKFVFNLTKIIGQHVLTEILQFLDNKLRKERQRGELSNCVKRSKYLLTLLGNITYQKHLYRGKEGRYRGLLDETLGLNPNQRMSTHYQKITGLFSFLAGSYHNAQRFLEYCYGDSVSFEAIRRQVQLQGSQIQRQEEYAFDQNLEEALKPTTLTPKSNREPLYLEIDGTMIHLQKQQKKKAELKLAIIHQGKEKRYPSGNSDAKKLKDKLAYTGLGPADEFMAQVSLLAEEKFHLYDHNLILVGGDGAPWIKEGAKDYFPHSIYQLCPFHLKRKLIQHLSYNRKRKSEISSLLGEGNLPEALILLEEEKGKNPPKKDELNELITYLVNNSEGINAVDRLKEAGLPVDTMGAIEGNIDKILANRFKKRGMSWSLTGALNLAKVGQLIINDDWDDFWPKEPEVILKQIEPKEEDHFPKEDKYDRRYSLPVLVGPHQDKSWVKQLKEFISIH